MRRILAIMILVALVAGCIGQTTVVMSDLKVSAMFDPSEINPLKNESTMLAIDIENTGSQNITNLTIDVFDTGPLYVTGPKSGSCLATLEELRPAQIQSVECTLAVLNPEALTQRVTNVEARFRISFQKSIASTFVADAMTLEEYRRLERLGRLEAKPQSMTFGDSQVQATLQFNKQPPFLAGDTVIAYLNIHNIGPGNVYTLDPKRFFVNQSEDLFKCSFENTIYVANGVFTPITCIMTVPEEIQITATYPITLTIGYDYELRDSVPMTIARY